MRESGRAQAAGRTAARDLFEQVRLRYFHLPPAMRRVMHVVVLIATVGVAAALGWDLFKTFLITLLVLAFLALTLRFPRAAATVLVLAGWCALLPVFYALFPPPSLAPTLLMVLAVPVAAGAHLIRWVTPWLTVLMALVPAGALAAAVSFVSDAAAVWIAYGAATAVLVQRFIAARRARGALSAEEQVRVRARDGRPEAPPEKAGGLPDISVEEALAELESMIGLAPVKEQVRSIAASIEASRLRAEAGYKAGRPTRHLVFLGPPGTGKTSVARTVAKIFYAFGLLDTPFVVEAQRADLVGEFLGATAIKTNELVDRALGGVLFVDEAYSLVNPGYSGGDAFGAEAVQTLLKRAEDDRDRLVIVLAGYQREMDTFLATNPGLASRFNQRVAFPSYSARELSEIAVLLADRSGDRFDEAALRDLDEVFAWVCDERLIDGLGNGRFARSLFERAAMRRDVRLAALAGGGGSASSAELTTITSDDVRMAVDELSGR